MKNNKKQNNNMQPVAWLDGRFSSVTHSLGLVNTSYSLVEAILLKVQTAKQNSILSQHLGKSLKSFLFLFSSSAFFLPGSRRVMEFGDVLRLLVLWQRLSGSECCEGERESE